MIRMRNPTKVEPPATFLKMRRCDHQEVDGDPTVAGAKTNTTALELAISKIWLRPHLEKIQGVVDSMCDSTILISGNIRTYLKEINHIGGSWPYQPDSRAVKQCEISKVKALYSNLKCKRVWQIVIITILLFYLHRNIGT